jgi:hypothetical protein
MAHHGRRAWSGSARANTTAAFDYATELLAVKSLSEAVELSTVHLRKLAIR